MHSLAICGDGVARLHPGNQTIATFPLDGLEVTTGILDSEPPPFDPRRPEHADMALVDVTAFSCNYRDRSVVVRAATHLPPDAWYAIGSEFVATVVAVGHEVDSLAAGDRVIPDGAWPATATRAGGLPTNHGSRGRQILPAAQLIAIPATLPDEAAAGFTIGAQTSYSMVRALDLAPGSTVLITAAGSNTALFAIQAARNAGHRVLATTSTSRFEDRYADLGVEALFVVDREASDFADHPGIAAATAALGGIDGVIDPFFDVHLPRVLSTMADGGRYVTCGLADQSAEVSGHPVPNVVDASMATVMTTVMLRGLRLVGNCLGSTADLQQALVDHADGRLRVVVDSRFGDGDAAGFLDRTFNAPERFGKVVYRHAADAAHSPA